MRDTYVVELRSAPIAHLDADVLERVSEELFEDRRLLGPAPSADLALRVLELRTAIEADGPANALEGTLTSFGRAIKRARLPAVDVVDASVWLDDDSEYDRRELLSGADIAERLGITRQRIAQFVSEKGRFPRPTATFGTVSVWQWGDVADWIAGGGRGAVNRLDAPAVLQVYALARDDAQRISAIRRMIALGNSADALAQSFLEHMPRSVAYRDDETRIWHAGQLVEHFESPAAAGLPSNTLDMLDALSRSVERKRAQRRRDRTVPPPIEEILEIPSLPSLRRTGKKTA